MALLEELAEKIVRTLRIVIKVGGRMAGHKRLVPRTSLGLAVKTGQYFFSSVYCRNGLIFCGVQKLQKVACVAWLNVWLVLLLTTCNCKAHISLSSPTVLGWY